VTWDRELQILENSIRQLGAEYDAFFYGGRPQPPDESRRRVEEMIRRLSSKEADSSADRYRFSALQGRYNALRERWERLQEEKEAGRRPGLYGHFAMTDGARRTRGTVSETLNAPPGSSVEGDRAPLRSSDLQLFERFLNAKKSLGENVTGYDFARFAEMLDHEREKLASRLGSVDIEFDVSDRDGRVRLVARRKN
jgi:hypothetical protein